MTAFISWYILITLLGWVMFPLAYRLFPALADRGYTLSRAFGLMLWGFVFWMFATFGIAQNDLGGLLLGLIVLGGLSAWAYFTQYEASSTQLAEWLQENRKLILTTEILFIVAFGFMAFFRSANPEILGTEKPMELMFINGIMNSPTFPPRDLWLSGYSISYYYFGYVMTAMLATFTGVPATMAFNLMLALIFGMAAVGAYGILYNLLAIGRKSNDESREIVNTCTWRKCRCRKSSIVNSLLAPLFLLLISNAEGFLEVLHARGLFWKDGSNFWTWLDIKEINVEPAPLAGRVFERLGYWWNQKAISEVPPPQAANWLSQTAYWMDLKFTLLGRWFAEQFLPDRYWWWWRASRVVQDYDLLRNPLEAIDEFPAFSFLLGDLHPHVLAIPFFLLAIAFALNLFLGGFRGQIDLYIGRLHISKTGFFLAAFMLGGMAFLNTWDILPIAAVIVFSYVLARVHEAGWGWERLEDILLFGIPAVVMAYVIYLPFFISFDSQASGILPSIMFPTRGAHLWVMWGALFIPIFAFLIYLLRVKAPADWRKGFGVGLGILLVLLILMAGVYVLVYKLRPDFALPYIQGQQHDVVSFFIAGMARRLSYIGGLLTLMALLIPSLAFLFSNPKLQTEENRSSFFVLLLVALGVLLILGPDSVYLQDNFGYRINTIFKFYYQAWLLISLASAYGTAVLLRAERRTIPKVEARRGANIIFSVIFVVILIIGLTYPVLGFPNKTNNFKPPFGFTLDDFDRVQRENPDEAAAILWLRSAPDGVIAEATGNPYSSYGRISIYTGLPTILGWGNHEGQWRDSSFQGLLNQRSQDIEALYTTPDWQDTQLILERYNVRYIVVGNLERTSYRVNEEKFNNSLKPVFQQGSVTIYEVP